MRYFSHTVYFLNVSLEFSVFCIYLCLDSIYFPDHGQMLVILCTGLSHSWLFVGQPISYLSYSLRMPQTEVSNCILHLWFPLWLILWLLSSGMLCLVSWYVRSMLEEPAASIYPEDGGRIILTHWGWGF